MKKAAFKKAYAGLALATAAFLVAGISVFSSARADVRALKAGKRLAAGLGADMSRLARYEAAEKHLADFANGEIAAPRLPMTVGKPDGESRETAGTQGGWRATRLTYSWKSIPVRRAVEALSALHAPKEGWRIVRVDFAALEGDSSSSLTVTIETAHPAEREL